MGFWNEDVFTEAEKTGGFEPVPAGEYELMLIDGEVKATKTGGHMLAVKFEITAPSNEGRTLFDNINVDNKNPKAVSIGLGHLKELATACGKIGWYESLKGVSSWDEAEAYLNGVFEALGNIPVIGKVTVKNDETYGAKNEIKGFKAAASSPVNKPAGKKDKASPWD